MIEKKQHVIRMLKKKGDCSGVTIGRHDCDVCIFRGDACSDTYYLGYHHRYLLYLEWAKENLSEEDLFEILL